ncbi:MAG: Crp/Fnr family transcriptional regulator [Chloroflexi bacterium]|nr:Crp/Fnr family transcriptional regulator [Chloroflexota bacterium]
MTIPTQEQLIKHLSANSFFTGLDNDTMKALTQEAVWREYAAGEVITLEGGSLSGFYFLQYGWVKVLKVSANGREQILRFLEPGETFYEVAIFSDQPNPVTAVALEKAGLWLIQRDVVMRLLRERPFFAERVLANMADRMHYLVSLVSDLSLRPVTGRLARLLLDSADGNVLHRPRWYTQAELAARLGTVPDVIQRVLREFEKEGLIEVKRSVITIHDPKTLAEKAA